MRSGVLIDETGRLAPELEQEAALLDAAADPDNLIPPPRPDLDAMLHGLVGDIARTAAEGSEVNPIAVAAAAMTWLSAEVGRDVYLPIGDTLHHARLFALHVGRSSRAGKGDALGLVRRLRGWLGTHHDGLLGQVHEGGVSSREGLAGAVHDGFKQGKDEVPAVPDKRLWIVETEFANLLAQGRRDGNTLLPALREVWDGGSIQPLTKGRGLWATRPHIALYGNITPGELRARIEAREVHGGTFNRILMVWAERTGLVPFPAPTAEDKVAALGQRVAEALWFAKGRYPETQNSRQASLTPAAATLYAELYETLRRPDPRGELIAAATERRAPICLRIALLHALLEGTLLITEAHIRVGCAWALYGADTAAYVLAGLGGEQRDRAQEDRLLAFLASQPGQAADRSAILRQCFGGHVSAKALDAVLAPLLTDGQLIRTETPPMAGGRPRVLYQLATANFANFAKNQQRRGFAGREVCANFANFAPAAIQNSQSSHEVRTAETLVNHDSSQSSQTSHATDASAKDYEAWAQAVLASVDGEVNDGEECFEL